MNENKSTIKGGPTEFDLSFVFFYSEEKQKFANVLCQEKTR
jgi:hypothetical protein